MKARNFSSFFLLFFLTTSVNAAIFQNLDDLHKQAIAFSENHYQKNYNISKEDSVKITAKALDRRLKLAKCDKDLTYSGQAKSQYNNNMSIKASCTGSKPWSIHISVKVAHFKPVLVAKQKLSRNQVISEADVGWARKDIYTLRNGYITNINDIKGLSVKRSIHEGKVIQEQELKKTITVKRGDAVIVEAGVGALKVVAPGIALSNGFTGQQIRVENRRSEKIVYAVVTGSGKVRVGL